MNKKLIVFIVAIFVTAGVGFFQSAEAQENTIIKSASEPDYPPFCIVDKNGQADGFSVELLKATLKAVNLDVSFYTAPWNQIKQDLADGKIQVLPLVGKTPERELVYDLTESYLTFYGAIFVRTGDTSIKTDKDLAGKEIAVLKGDNAEDYVRRENISSRIVTAETYKEAFTQLSEGKYDAVVAQQRMGTNLIKTLGIKNVVAVDYRLDKFKQEFTFAVKKGDTGLLAELDKGLAIVKINGTFDKLYQKWFAESGAKLNYLLIILLIVLTFIATISVSAYLIRKKYK
ncbi:MAG: transporter substrate-binding domain-containing protein [Candidatus Staskawiczbacteria bacterium]|nr:transporter substrate-binding domain-containing protein [Candidatus Staskawiczbacteria bacterium]